MSLAKIAKDAKKNQRFNFRIRTVRTSNSAFPTLAILAILARDFFFFIFAAAHGQPDYLRGSVK